ncbi:SDR family oxidoreductase [Coralloluteibacterium thermophilus]|uniref:SDR family oxidoreductase n=1 Tax=Coralloluteibacterium thermophilum TaxID=2707049 RepID=A0ABV9NQ42_9GAMM
MSPTSPVALVTGASRGIGRAIAERLADDGFLVIVNYATDAAAAEGVVAALHHRGAEAFPLRADVSDPAEVERLFGEIRERFGQLRVVVHNAGVMPLAPIAPESIEAFDRAVAVNLRSTFLMMGHAGTALGSGGRFIALSTSVLARNFPAYGPYIASKAGVEGLVRVFANELRGRGITVNAVAPGPVATELFFAGKTAEQIQHSAQLSPLERLGEPADVANAVAFLCGPDGGWVNAQVVRVNGGFA